MKFYAFASLSIFVATVSSFPTVHLEAPRGHAAHPAAGVKEVKGYKRDSAVAEVPRSYAAHPAAGVKEVKGYKRHAADEASELHYKRNLHSDPSEPSFGAETEVDERSAVEVKREPGCDE